MAKYYKQITTEVGSAIYPHVRSTEVFDGKDSGKFTCSLKFSSKEQTDKLIAQIEQEWENAKKTPEFADKRFGRNTFPSLGFRENKDGDIVFKAKTNAVLHTKAGEVVEITVAVFDKNNHLMSEDAEIGHGSTIQMCFALRPFYASSSIYGMQLLLKAVRVVNYLPPNGGDKNPENFGFGAPVDAPEGESDIPFSTSYNEEDEF